MIKGNKRLDSIFIIIGLVYFIFRYFESKSLLGLGFDYLVGTAWVCVIFRLLLRNLDKNN